jgi:hypothetical protein
MMAKPTKKSSIKPPTLLLQKWQRNQIFEAIQAVGLDPREFDLGDDGTDVRIKHKRSKSCFIVGGDAGHYVGSYVVGDAPDWPYEVYSWTALMPRVSRWLEDVKRDLETPDLWAELQREAKLLAAGPLEATENTPFTAEEQKEIAGQLRELAKQTKRTYSPSRAQMRLLDEKLDYLMAASGRIGRTDWRGVFVGVMLSFLLSTALPPESVRQILLPFLRGIGHLFGLLELPK